jgi:hypothetical protein
VTERGLLGEWLVGLKFNPKPNDLKTINSKHGQKPQIQYSVDRSVSLRKITNFLITRIYFGFRNITFHEIRLLCSNTQDSFRTERKNRRMATKAEDKNTAKAALLEI